MITVRVIILLNGKKGQIRVNPSSTIDALKKKFATDLASFDIGEPDDFQLAIATRNKKATLDKISIREGDTIYIINEDISQANVAEINPNAFD